MKKTLLLLLALLTVLTTTTTAWAATGAQGTAAQAEQLPASCGYSDYRLDVDNNKFCELRADFCRYNSQSYTYTAMYWGRHVFRTSDCSDYGVEADIFIYDGCGNLIASACGMGECNYWTVILDKGVEYEIILRQSRDSYDGIYRVDLHYRTPNVVIDGYDLITDCFAAPEQTKGYFFTPRRDRYYTFEVTGMDEGLNFNMTLFKNRYENMNCAAGASHDYDGRDFVSFKSMQNIALRCDRRLRVYLEAGRSYYIQLDFKDLDGDWAGRSRRNFSFRVY